jgi:hypothetical protein
MTKIETLVYVIAVTHCGEAVAPCKIGISANLPNRLSQLQTASPVPLMIFKHFRLPSRSIAADVESCFHETHKGYRMKGEWFRIEPEKAASILALQIRIMVRELTTLEDCDRRIIYESIGVA